MIKMRLRELYAQKPNRRVLLSDIQVFTVVAVRVTQLVEHAPFYLLAYLLVGCLIVFIFRHGYTSTSTVTILSAHHVTSSQSDHSKHVITW